MEMLQIQSKQWRLKKNAIQYNIHIFNKAIFFKYRTKQIKTTETNKKVKQNILPQMIYKLGNICIIYVLSLVSFVIF